MKRNSDFYNESSVQSQNNRILAHLRANKMLTSIEALDKFGCMRLASRIHDIRVYLERGGTGEEIVSERIMYFGKCICRYSLKKKEKKDDGQLSLF